MGEEIVVELNRSTQPISAKLFSSNRKTFAESLSEETRAKSSDRAFLSASNLLTRMTMTMIPVWLAGGNAFGSVKPKSWVMTILDSFLANWMTAPLAIPQGALLASWPSSLSQGNKPTCIFSSMRKNTLGGGARQEGIEFNGLNDFRGKMKGCLNMLWSQIGIGFQNFLDRSPIFQHLQDKINHNPGSLKAGLAMADIGINPNIFFKLFFAHRYSLTGEEKTRQEAGLGEGDIREGDKGEEEGKALVFLANGEGNLAGHLRQAQDEIKTLKENLEELRLEFSKLRNELTKNSGPEGGK